MPRYLFPKELNPNSVMSPDYQDPNSTGVLQSLFNSSIGQPVDKLAQGKVLEGLVGLGSNFAKPVAMLMSPNEAEGATMFHGSPRWWKNLQFDDSFMKSGEGATVKGSGHYTTGSPEHALERYVEKLRGDIPTSSGMSWRKMQGDYQNPMALMWARDRLLKAKQDRPDISEDTIRRVRDMLNAGVENYHTANISDLINLKPSFVKTGNIDDVLSFAKANMNESVDNARAVYELQKNKPFRPNIQRQRENASQGNLLTVDLKRPLDDYVNYEGLVAADPKNSNALWHTVKQNDLARKIFESNVGDSWADMVKGLENPFGQKGASEILQNSGIAGNLHTNMTSRADISDYNLMRGSDIGSLVRSGNLDPSGLNAVTINPQDMSVIGRSKSLEDLYKNLDPNWKQTWE